MQTIRSFSNTCFVRIFQAAEKHEFIRWAGVGIVVAVVVMFPFLMLHH